MEYRGYRLENNIDEILVYNKSEQLVGSEQTYKRAKTLVDLLIEKNVTHESEL